MASHRWLVALSVSLLLPVVQPLHASEAESLEARVQRLESELATLKALLEATLTDPAVADDANLAIVDIKPDGRPAALARQQEPQAAAQRRPHGVRCHAREQRSGGRRRPLSR